LRNLHEGGPQDTGGKKKMLTVSLLRQTRRSFGKMEEKIQHCSSHGRPINTRGEKTEEKKKILQQERRGVAVGKGAKHTGTEGGDN